MLPNLAGLHIKNREGETEGAVLDGLGKRPSLRVKRRPPELAKQIAAKTGAYGELLDSIKREVVAALKNSKHVGACTVAIPTLFWAYLENVLMSSDSWVQQAPFTLPGYTHNERLTEDEMLDLVKAYRSVRPAGTPDFKPWGAYNLETAEEQRAINQALAEYAEHFKPMIDALRGAGFVAPNHNGEFEIKWRFQGVRHAHASVWHMDAGEYSPYADESGEQLEAWTQSGTRCVVTAGCVDTTGNSRIHNCGTKVLSGVPVLTEEALKNLTSTFLADPNRRLVCNAAEKTKRRLTDTVFNATTTALGEYTKRGKRLEEAGIQVFALQNGVIATHNDSVFHSADNSTPEGFARCFFVACPTIRDTRNLPVSFRLDATLSDDSKLMFTCI